MTPVFDAVQSEYAEVANIRAFLQNCSFEATRPDVKDAALLVRSLGPRAQIYLSAVPHRPVSETIDAACLVRGAGLEPVPHMAARNFASLRAFELALERLTGEADVKTVLLIGGDLDRPAGTLASAQQVIDSGVLRKYGLTGIGVAGYPEPHPRIHADEIEAALLTKSAAAQAQGLDVHIVTQFCFDSRPILRWIAWLRQRGIHLPVKVGLAGPTSVSSWLSYARRCGVKASASALASRSGLVKHLFSAVAPDPVIRELAGLAAAGRLADVSAHMFSFGGIAASARWLHGAQAGEFSLEADGGFHVNMG